MQVLFQKIRAGAQPFADKITKNDKANEWTQNERASNGRHD